MNKLSTILFLLLCVYSHAQIKWCNPNFREKIIHINDSIVLDSLQILPEKFSLKDMKGNSIPLKSYIIKGNILYLKQPITDSLLVSYYVHPTFKKIVTYPRDPSLIVSTVSEKNAVGLSNQSTEEKKIFSGLISQGNIVRGVMFGNNQGSSVQSSLNLKLEGELTENVGIRAFISDTNAPIEVGGYTQNLNQFDRVYLELFTNKSTLKAGQIELGNDGSYFGKFQRKVTGAKISHTFKAIGGDNLVEVAGSLSRGQYTRDEFYGVDGNQGPYQLSGNNNERYVLIIAGSERVYRNGILLLSGADNDYVIDYTTGEIIFSAKHLVTSNDRYIVEYQYTNQNYNRFAWYGGFSHIGNKYKVAAHIYSENDNKNQLINQELSKEDRELLQNIGNDVGKLLRENAKLSEFQEDRVLYEKIEINGNKVFKYSTDNNKELYEVKFTYVGNNKGNYILSNSSINGRVFAYVEPENGEMQGDYSSKSPLIAPEKKQLISVSAEYKLDNSTELNLDVGISNYDKNLFSEKGNDENVGLGIKSTFVKNFKWDGFMFKPQVSYEFIQDKFHSIERLRSPEFARDFNLENEIHDENQHFLQTNFMFNFNETSLFNYGLDYLKDGGVYSGYKHRANGLLFYEDYLFSINGSYLKSQSDIQRSDFLQYNVKATRRLKDFLFELGSYGESKINTHTPLDSLSYRWNDVYASITKGDSLSKYFKIKGYYRLNDSVFVDKLKPYSNSWGLQMNSTVWKTENYDLQFLSDYRNVMYHNSQPTVSFLNAEIRSNNKFLNKGLFLNLSYGLSGNTEQQRGFTYVKVADGLGIYKWIDFNQDGVQQIDEFQVAEFTDQANYIRVFTHVVHSIRTNQNRLGLNLRILPSKFLSGKIWKRFQSHMAVNINGNYLKNNNIAAWDPFSNIDDLRSGNANFFIQSDWNKGKNYRWHITHVFKKQKNTNLIFTGLESIENKENNINIKYDFSQFIQAEVEQKYYLTKSNSESFSSKRYWINGLNITPKINAFLGTDFKSSLAFVYKRAGNKKGNEMLESRQLNLSLNWNDSEKTQLLANLDWIKNNFKGNQGSLVANRMMDGLKEGNNLVWNLTISRKINSFMVFNILYSGRKNQHFRAIHTGNMEIRLNF